MYNRFYVALYAAAVIISYSSASETSKAQKPASKTVIAPVAKELYEQQREAAKKMAMTAHLYRGKAITPDSIKELEPKIDAASLKAINGWMRSNVHVVSFLVNLPVHGTLEERMKRYEFVKTVMEASGYKNLSNHNFVFAIEVPVDGATKKYVLKIAGPANRRENYNASQKKEYGTPITLDEHEKIEKEGALTTYQGISRVAHSLRLQEWIEQNPKEGVVTPACYLIHIPGTDTTVSDKNYVVVEEFVEHIGTPAQHPLVFLARIPALMKAIVHTGLWNIASRQFLITPEREVACIDLEQPNNENPQDFFHKNQDKYCGNIGAGLKELADLEQELIEQVSKTEKDTERREYQS